MIDNELIVLTEIFFFEKKQYTLYKKQIDSTSPLRRKKSRSPFADDATGPSSTLTNNWPAKAVNYTEHANNQLNLGHNHSVGVEQQQKHIVEPELLSTIHRSSNTDTIISSNNVISSNQSTDTTTTIGTTG
ncbi:unnamed protein product [Schistosoma turkestanicum]|nr:unnamed protein product [Schistosoma turkestanicum]